MSERASKTAQPRFEHMRNWFAEKLGVKPEQKEEIYIQISRSASLRDVSYWLQVLFSAGIATLGLVLNSPAVIIGAMLISPLMGPILASGLTLATGDLILGVRAITNLILSCMLAIFFAVLLVSILPFKEVTSEIAARTQPNTLDLAIALFSGAVGSIAICKEVKGVVTSIPGVAIAVALMPPLCVVGFGLGVAVSSDATEGMRVARGGALLFLTNLIAITFTAMVVFVALHIDTQRVKERVREWREQDKESIRFREALGGLPAAMWIRKLDSLPGRFLLILITLTLLLIPLSRSFSQLRSEIARKQQENQIRRAATEIWEQNFSRLPTGEPRCYLGQISMLDQQGKLALVLRVFTSKSFTASEKAEYTRLLASRIKRSVESIVLQLIEIPTTTSELLTRKQEDAAADKREQATVLTLAQLQQNFSHEVENSLSDLKLPPPARLVNYDLKMSAGQPVEIRLVYLSDRDIEADAQNLIVAEVKERLENTVAGVQLERIPPAFGPLNFSRNRAEITETGASLLDPLGRILREQSTLRVEISAASDKGEREGIVVERAEAIKEYLVTKYGIAPDQLTVSSSTEPQRETTLLVKTDEGRTIQ
jgi:uncharacterized hydrophobic protein (TIGR00271 family)